MAVENPGEQSHAEVGRIGKQGLWFLLVTFPIFCSRTSEQGWSQNTENVLRPAYTLQDRQVGPRLDLLWVLQVPGSSFRCPFTYSHVFS